MAQRVESNMRRHFAAGICALTLGLAVLSACDSGAATNSNASASASSPVTPSPQVPSAVLLSPSQSVPPSSAPTPPAATPTKTSPPIMKPPTSSGGQITLSGQIYGGAEPSCLLMRQGTAQYLLLPDNKSIKLHAGLRVVVTGHIVHGMMSHCQQGIPFQVTGVDPLAP